MTKFVAIGLNYPDHAKEAGMANPDRADRLHQGQQQPVRTQRQRRKAARLDQARLGSRDRDHHRHPRQIRLRSRRAQLRRRLQRLQRRLRALLPDRTLRQWTKGKSHDTFGPLGPWLVTKDEIADVQKLPMWTRRQRQALPDRIDRDHDLRREEVRVLSVEDHDADAGRRHPAPAPRPASASA